MEKPVPKPNADSQPFWDGCNCEEFLYQQCQHCGQSQFYPRAICSHCHSQQLDWRRSEGCGSIHSFTEVHRAPTAAFKADTPYMIALIDMDEGFRFMANVLGSSPAAVRIGARVRVIFERRGDQRIPQVTLVG